MTIRYVRKFDYVLACIMALFLVYAFRENRVVISGIVILLPLYIWMTWNLRVTLSEDKVFLKRNPFLKGVSIEYSYLKEVNISKAYGTTLLDMFFHFTYIVNGKKRILKLNLYNEAIGKKIIKILKDKGVQYEYGDDYIEMILERPI